MIVLLFFVFLIPWYLWVWFLISSYWRPIIIRFSIFNGVDFDIDFETIVIRLSLFAIDTVTGVSFWWIFLKLFSRSFFFLVKLIGFVDLCKFIFLYKYSFLADMRGYPWTVLRPGGAFQSGGRVSRQELPLLGRLRGQGLLQRRDLSPPPRTKGAQIASSINRGVSLYSTLLCCCLSVNSITNLTPCRDMQRRHRW